MAACSSVVTSTWPNPSVLRNSSPASKGIWPALVARYRLPSMHPGPGNLVPHDGYLVVNSVAVGAGRPRGRTRDISPKFEAPDNRRLGGKKAHRAIAGGKRTALPDPHARHQ